MSMNLLKPSWLTSEVYENLKDIHITYLDSWSYYEAARRLNAGPIIEKILLNIENNNNKSDEERKIYLYSGHDLNIAAFIRAHNFTSIPSIPDYGSGVIVEKLRNYSDIHLRVSFIVVNKLFNMDS